MFGLEILIPTLIGEVIKEVVTKIGGSPEAAQAVAQMATDNPEVALVATGSPVMAFSAWALFKFIKMPEKKLKFRKGLHRAIKYLNVGIQWQSKFLEYMKNLEERLEKECFGGVCELPKDEK